MSHIPTAAHGHGAVARLVRDGEAELAAAAVVDVARVVGHDQLRLLAEDLDPVQPVGLLHLLHDDLVAAAELVHADYGVQPPVRHEEVLLEDDEGEGVPDQPGLDGLHVLAVQVGVLQHATLLIVTNCRS